jgi:hypothetical protein
MTRTTNAPERIVWEGWCSIELPPGWSWNEERGVISIFQDAGVGALQMSFARRQREQSVGESEPLELINAWASSRGWTDLGVQSAILAGSPAALLEHVEGGAEPTYWKIWEIVEKKRAALITYVCELPDADVERVARDQIVRSFMWD